MSSLKDDASLILIPSLYKDGRLDTVKPLGNSIVHPDATGNHDGTDGSTLPEANFTFSRGSNLAATRVDVNGLIEKGRENLITYSNDFQNASWTLGGIQSITTGQSGYDGSLDASLIISDSALQGHQIAKSGETFTGLQTYSVYAKNGGYDLQLRATGIGSTNIWISFDLTNGVVGTSGNGLIDSSITSVGGGWYRCSMTFTTTASPYIGLYQVPDGATAGQGEAFSGDGTSGLYIQDAQVERSMVATDYIETGASTAQAGILEDMPRLDYSGGASCPSLLLEPQRSNLLPHSEYLADTSNWPRNGSSVISNSVISPEGVQNASTLVADGTSGTHRITEVIVLGVGKTLSVFAKAGTNNFIQFYTDSNNNDYANFDLLEGEVGSVGVDATASIEDYGNGWYRCIMTTGNAASQNFAINIVSSASAVRAESNTLSTNVYLYGGQIETGSYPTSYIPTYGSSVTRSFDNAGTRTDMQDFLGTDTGAWFMHLDEFYFDITGTGLGAIILAKNGQQATSIELVQDGNFQYKVTLNNSTALENLDGEDKLLMNWSSEFFKIFVNGVERYSSTSSQWSNAFTHLILPQTTRAPHIKIKQMLFFPTALTDSECIALTE